MSYKAAKPDKYSSKEEADDLEALSNKLATDLRKHIRQLGNFPLFSDSWFEMADVCGRIANVSDMESKLPGSKDEATLWETEEQALRFLLEDGKLNLCLRNLVEYKLHQRRAHAIGTGPIFDFSAECDKFERGMGVILRNAWSHVEALQTTDLIGLVNHIADVLESALEAPSRLESHCRSGDLHQRQEIMCFYYLHDLLRNVGEISEDRIMPTMRERGMFMLGVRLLEQVHMHVLSTHVLKACQALSLLCETEDFNTHLSAYVHTSDVEVIVKFRTGCVATLVTDFDSRRKLRPLVDSIDKIKRQLGRSMASSATGGGGGSGGTGGHGSVRPVSAALAGYRK